MVWVLLEQNNGLHQIVLSLKIHGDKTKVEQNIPHYFHINEKLSVDKDAGKHRWRQEPDIFGRVCPSNSSFFIDLKNKRHIDNCNL